MHINNEGQPVIELTPLEEKILNDLAYGLSKDQISAKRDLSHNRTERCVTDVYAKLGAASRQNLITKAFVHGLLDESEFDAAVAVSVAVAPAQRRPAGCFP
ncbi:MAG: hypothetical protein NVS2B17_32680 [Candidatus Velthaea sp.]